MNTAATVKLILDTQTNNEERFLKIRVTFKRQPRLYSTICNTTLTKEEFANPKLKKTKAAIDIASSSVTLAKEICEELGNDFSFPAFSKIYKKRLYGEKRNLNRFEDYSKTYLDNLKGNTKDLYTTAVNWVLRFKKDILLSDFNPDTVHEIINFIKFNSKADSGKEMSENTIRIYLRELRAIYNQAIKDEQAAAPNPFSNIKGQPLSSIIREKGSLTDDELESFMRYDPVSEIEKFGKDFFKLSLQLCGANFGDILSLKNKNIIENQIHFIRRKTSKRGIETILPLTDIAKDIFNEYGCFNPLYPDEYILPFLSQCSTENMIKNKIHDLNKKVNQGLQKICKAIGIRKITTYNARHTYASFAQDILSPSQIQKFLGHSSSNTTQIYLGSISRHTQDLNKEVLKQLASK